MSTISRVGQRAWPRSKGVYQFLEMIRQEMNGIVTLLGNGVVGEVLVSEGPGMMPIWSATGDMVKSIYDPDADGVFTLAKLEEVLVLVQSEPPTAEKGRLYYDADDDHLYLCTAV